MATIVPVRPAPLRQPRVAGPRLPQRVRRVAAVAAAIVLLVALVSWIGAMSGPSNTALGIRSVEWLRDNGAAGLVAQIETWYYEATAPAKGGRIKSLPSVGDTSAGSPQSAGRGVSHHHAAVLARPAAVAPMIQPALAGEGAWHPTRAGLGPAPPIMVTTLRNEPEYPQEVVALAWIDTRRTQTLLYTGRLEPAVTLPTRGPMEVPAGRRDHLLATFNSGFKLADSLGGYTVHGHTYAPLKNGLATFVGYRDGRINIVPWQHGPVAPPDVLYARQNLPLIVDHGRANPKLDTGADWGATVGNAILVWRSGIGIDRHGNLIYAAGNDQTVMSLAAALIRAGAVRAMELDINSYWVSFITYGGWGALNPVNLLPTMNRPPERYLTPDDRDFFAVYLRTHPLK
jgi:hypothetical protein